MKNPPSLLPTPLSEPFTDAASVILDNLPEAILLVDTSFVLLACNRAAKTAFWRLKKIIALPGMPILNFVSAKQHARFETIAHDVLNGQFCRIEKRRKTTNTEIYETSFSPARNVSGEITGILVRSVNVTQQKTAESAIQEAEERWQFAFEASSQAAWDWNMQTNEVIYSSSYKKMYGFGDDLKNDLSEWQRRIHPDDKHRIDQAIKEHAQSDNPLYETTYRIQLNNGQYKWIMARGKLLNKDGEGRPLRMIGTHTDLTQTLQAKEELNKMNERFNFAARASSQALWEWNAVTGEAYVSPSFTQMFGWQADENNRFEQWHQYIHPDDKIAIVNGYYESIANPEQTIWEADYRFLKADGSYAFVCDKAYIIRDGQNQVTKVIGATQDVSPLKRVENELLKNNERFATMMKATHDMLWDWDMETDCFYRSPDGLKKVCGVADNETVKSIGLWRERVHPDDLEKVHAILNSFVQADHHQTFELEYRFKRDDGRYTHIYDRGILLKNADGKAVRMIGAAQNISERKRMEEELLQNALEMKKRINQATVDSQEQERNEIGRELHDNVNQVLTTTRLYLELALANKDLTDDLIKKSAENVGNIITEIRQLSRSLMDPSISDLGIVDSINDLVENLNLARHVRIDLDIDPKVEIQLSRKQQLTVFRIIQEALNNVIRHAAASCASVRVQQESERIFLAIKDNGVGFSFDSVKKGAGLKNILNRVYLINGTFNVQSQPARGTTIKINFPVKDLTNA